MEIHNGGKAQTATFKWSRENGSVAFPIDADSGTNITSTTIIVKLKHWWRDRRLGLVEGDWVEIVDDYIALHQLAHSLWKVDKIEPEDFLVTLSRGESSGNAESKTINKDSHPLLRRWDHKERSGLTLTNGAIPISEAENDWFTLEDGVQIKFDQEPEQEHSYRTGDYWLIPARTATGDVEWDEDGNGEALAIPPHGVKHHYAPLAVISDNEQRQLQDCRHEFTF